MTTDQEPTVDDSPGLDSDGDAVSRSGFDEEFDINEDPGAEIGIDEPRELWRLLRTPVVSIVVGPSEQRFWLHRGLLERHSLYFRGLLRSGFQENRDEVVKLPEDDVAAFAVFAEWLYLGHEADTSDIRVKALQSPREQRSGGSEGEINGEDAQGVNDDEEGDASEISSTGRYDHYDFKLQLSSYVLADKLVAPEFSRHILEEIRLHVEFCDPSQLTADLIRYTYKNTMRNDPVRGLCIAIKCIIAPIGETLADPEFQELMEEGGPLVRDVMEVCRKHATRENWDDHAEELDVEDGYEDREESVDPSST